MPTYTSLNFFEFFTAFPTEESCEEHLIRVRWPVGMPCNKCDEKDFYKRISTRRAYQCRHCRSLTSPTAGTIFHRTRTPLRAWFLAIFYKPLFYFFDVMFSVRTSDNFTLTFRR